MKEMKAKDVVDFLMMSLVVFIMCTIFSYALFGHVFF